MDVETKKVATLVKAGWDTSDLRALGPKWFNITYLETAVRAGLTVQDLTALSQTPDRLQPSQVSTVCEVASSRAEAMNWLASLDALAASRRTLAHSLFGHSLKVEIWRSRDALGPDASWYAAAGLALNEAVSLNVEPDRARHGQGHGCASLPARNHLIAKSAPTCGTVAGEGGGSTCPVGMRP